MKPAPGKAVAFLIWLIALVLAAAIWLPLIHVGFAPRVEDYFAPEGLTPGARALAAHQVFLWTDPASRERSIARMRTTNAEWDFMGRTFLALALANIALRDPGQQSACLDVIDRILEETLRLETEKGPLYFLMDYAKNGAFLGSSGRSLFVDGEIALMLAARQLVEERPDFAPLLRERVDALYRQMEEGPLLCGESYPDECWTFCNAVALAALRMSDALDGRDHGGLIRPWIATAKNNLIEPTTGLLRSCFLYDGSPADGPEGSTIWMVAHGLQLLDPAFAEDQYRRARKELARQLFGFGYAREWPESCKGLPDVDSGPSLPFGISAGSSGMAVLGAAAFGDRDFLRHLLTSLSFGGFPIRENGRLRFAASNQVGDAVLLYALVQGPLWREVERRAKGALS